MSSAEKQMALQRKQIALNNNNEFQNKFMKSIELFNYTGSSMLKQKSLSKNASQFLYQDQINNNTQVQLENLNDQDIPENSNNETEISQLLDEELDEKQMSDEIFNKIFEDYKPKITTFFEKDLIRELSNLQAKFFIQQQEIDKKGKFISEQFDKIKNCQQQIDQLNKQIGDFYESQRQKDNQIMRLEKYAKNQEELYKQIKGMLSIDIANLEKKALKKVQKTIHLQDVEQNLKINIESEKQNISSSKLSAMSQSLQQPKIQSKHFSSQNGLLKLNTVGYNQMKSSYGLSSAKVADTQTKNQNFFRYPEETRHKQNSITLSQSNKKNNNQKTLLSEKNQKQKNQNSQKSQSIQQFPSLVA